MIDSVVADPTRAHWDNKYQQGLPSLEKPDPFFLSAFRRFVADAYPSAGRALDLAGGVGRHALWLAQQSWQMTVVDISAVAVDRLRQKAEQLDLSLELLAIDAQDYAFPSEQFDLILMFYHFDRQISPRVLSALKPGGTLICKSSVLSTPYIGPAPHHLRPLQDNEILALLPGLRVELHRERPVRDRGVVEYVGVKAL